MVSLLLLQSFAATVDAHQFHQSGIQHVSFENHLQDDGVNENSMPSTTTNIDSDCQHCCHCHCIAGILIGAENNVLQLNKSVARTALFQSWSITQRTSSLYRPPIA